MSKINKIEHFILPKQYNEIYQKEAISAISLTRDVADKINELIDTYNLIADTDLEWKHEIEGTVRKAVIYIKDNLMNTLHELMKIYQDNGFLAEYVKEYTNELENRVEILLTGGVVDGEVMDIRYGSDGVTYKSAGESVRTQIDNINTIIDNVYDTNKYLYTLPLNFTFEGTATYGRFDSKGFKIPEDGCSVRVTDYITEIINDIECKFLTRIYIGKMVAGVFVEDKALTQKYTPNVYSNRIIYIPYIEGYYVKISASFIGDGETRVTTNNYKLYRDYLKYIKVYTGKISNNGGLLGLTPVTIRKAETEEKYTMDWNLNGLTWKYQSLASPLPLKYIKSVSCNPDMWIGAKIYKFNQATRTTEFIETLNYNDTHPCFGSECKIDFSKYDDNYFAILILGKVPLNEDYQGATFGTSSGTNNAVTLGFDLSDIESGINVEWINDNVIKQGLEGVSLPVQKNIELLKNIKVNKPSARFGNDISQTWYHIFNKENFSGIFYGGGYQAGTFYYHISPVAYYTALLNPNSNAYGDCDTEKSGYKYGIVCSNFTAMLHGYPTPLSTFDFRYNTFEEFDIEKFNLNTDISKLKLYDLITQGAGETGHTVMVSDVINVDNSVTGLKVMEAVTPATRENIFFLHNGIPYLKGTPEEWYQGAYDYVAFSKPEYDTTIFDKANWNLPYTEPQKVMCSRGYGSIYIENKNSVILSVAEDVTEIVISKDNAVIQRINLTELSLTTQNGYKLLDITEYVSAGTYKITNNVDDGEEIFSVINIDSYYVTASSSDNENIKITTSHNKKVKYVNVIYQAVDGNYKGKRASMCYKPNFDSEGYMSLPVKIQTEDIGLWSAIASENLLDSVNVIFKTDYDTNTFFVDGENDKGC